MKIQGIGLALGGGAVRGVAHLGVLDVLINAGIPIAAISGTSVGALVAAVYATQDNWLGAETLAQQINHCALEQVKKVQLPLKENATWLERLLRLTSLQKTLIRALTTSSAFTGKGLDKLINDLLQNKTFQDARLPLFIAATDISCQEGVVLKKGSLAKAVRASAAIPGVFPPIEWEGKRLVDGAVTSVIPIEALKPHADIIVGVDVSDAIVEKNPKQAVTIAWQASHLSMRQLRKHESRLADVMICANAKEAILAFDFSKVDELIALGKRAAQNALPEIVRKLEQQNKHLKTA